MTGTNNDENLTYGEEWVQKARAQAQQVASAVPTAAQMEALRAEAARLFVSLPEPPAYPRADDPVRKKAAESLPAAAALLGRFLAASQAVTPPDERLTRLTRAVELHLRALAAIGAGEVAQSDYLTQEAWEAAREVTRASPYLRVEKERMPPVYDRETQTSRYDSQPKPTLTVQLYCANRNCRQLAAYAVAPNCSTHRFTCSQCKQPFTGYLADIRHVQSRTGGKVTRYVLNARRLGGGEAKLEFDDASGGQLTIAPGDAIALLYAGTGSLAAVENLATGQVLWIAAKGACFIATAVFGEDAAELDTFRAFRDQVLLTSSKGRALVNFYYRVGPTLAKGIAGHPVWRRVVRSMLLVVRRLLLVFDW